MRPRYCYRCYIRIPRDRHRSGSCAACKCIIQREIAADFRCKPNIRDHARTAIHRTAEGRYYTCFRQPRRCLHCQALLSVFRDASYCRPCIRAGRGYDHKHVMQIVRELMWRTGRRVASARYRMGDMQRQDTRAPAWVHSMADALEQWETYCEEIAR